MSVTKVDFGKETREAQTAFARLSGLVEARDEAYLKNPKKFFEDAGRAIYERGMIIRLAKEALHSWVSVQQYAEPISFQSLETLVVRRDEWERLQACAAIIRGTDF